MTTATSNSIAAPLFSTNYHIYINHTDAGGIVYHTNHLVFFENCRRDWFTKLGLNGYFMHSDDGELQHFVVSQAQLQYKKAIFLDEIINVRIDKVELKPASIVFYQSIHRQVPENADEKSTSDANTLLSSTKIVIACVQNQTRPESVESANNTDPVASAVPIRPIRVPENLHRIIKQAILAHQSSEQ